MCDTEVVYADLGFDVDYYFLDSNFVDAKPPEEDPNHNMCPGPRWQQRIKRFDPALPRLGSPPLL